MQAGVRVVLVVVDGFELLYPEVVSLSRPVHLVVGPET